MYDVFLSYKSERRPAVRHLAKVLELYGYSVWYDHKLVAGADFARQIDDVLQNSKVVMPLWCKLSVESDWVLEEAHVAKEHGVILPVMIEQIRLPFGFTRLDTVDLTSWDASPRSHSIDRLIDEVARIVSKSPTIDYAGLRAYEESWRNFGAPSLAQFALSEATREEADAPRSTQTPRPQTPPTTPPPETPQASAKGNSNNNSPNANDLFGDMDMFSEFFGDRQKSNATKGADLKYRLSITLEEAFHGETKALNFEANVPCDACNGSGKINGQTCSKCSGSGVHPQQRTLSVKIPPGVSDGTRLRLQGEGEPGQQRGFFKAANGDFYVEILIAPHARFAVDATNLHVVEKISAKTARKGGYHRLQDINGDTLELTIPKGANPGQKFRLRGKGMTDVHKPDGSRGDLYVELDF